MQITTQVTQEPFLILQTMTQLVRTQRIQRQVMERRLLPFHIGLAREPERIPASVGEIQQDTIAIRQTLY